MIHMKLELIVGIVLLLVGSYIAITHEHLTFAQRVIGVMFASVVFSGAIFAELHQRSFWKKQQKRQ